LLCAVQRRLTAMPEKLTCHQVCERLAAELPQLRHVRGKFNGAEHSWLEVRGTQLVLDPYPWACASGPLLVDTSATSPWRTLYCEIPPPCTCGHTLDKHTANGEGLCLLCNCFGWQPRL
jgi:hypothetical protein